MTLNDLKKRINNLPSEMKEEDYSSAEKYLTNLREKYVNYVKDVDEKEFGHFSGYPHSTGIKSDVIKDLNAKIQDFNAKCNDALRPDCTSRQYDEFFNIFFDETDGCINKDVMTEVIAPGCNFYRVRGTNRDINQYELYDHKGMYMMNPGKSEQVKPARFNLSGYPCLYLAESLYLAWEECRRPDFHTANFSRFSNCKKLRVLCLTIPQRLNNIPALFRAYVGLVCSIKAKDDEKDHWQYRITNLFIKMVYQYKNAKIDGIKYISSRRFEKKDFKIEYTNECAAFVFPPKDISEKHCKKLAGLFEMTEAFSYFYFKLYGISFKSTKVPNSREYNNTIFRFLESQLIKEKTTPCVTIIS